MAENKLLKQAVDRFKYLTSCYRDRAIECTFCKVCVRLREWSEHLKTAHDLDCRVACPYCRGALRWQRGEAQNRLDVAQHRVECFEKFLSQNLVSSRDEMDPAPRLILRDDVVPASVDAQSSARQSQESQPCSCVEFLVREAPRPDLRGRCPVRDVRDETLLLPYGNGAIFDQDLGAGHVKFTDSSGLGSSFYNAVYHFFEGKHQFFHVMVRAELWPKFVNSEISMWVDVLPWWCLCDGSHSSDRREIHRHMLFMVQKDNGILKKFKQEWKALVLEGGGALHERNKLCKSIDTPDHLMNSVFYVSNYASTCDGYGNAQKLAQRDGGGSHFWLARQVYPHAKIAMGCLWRGGHAKHIANTLRHKSVHSFVDHVLDRPMRVQLRYCGLSWKNCVIPFAEDYIVSAAAAPVLPAADTKVFPRGASCPVVMFYETPVGLDRVPDLPRLGTPAWFELQTQRKNVFWNGVWDEFYALNRHQRISVVGIRRVLARENKRNRDAEMMRYANLNHKLQMNLEQERKEREKIEQELEKVQQAFDRERKELEKVENELRETCKKYTELVDKVKNQKICNNIINLTFS